MRFEIFSQIIDHSKNHPKTLFFRLSSVTRTSGKLKYFFYYV